MCELSIAHTYISDLSSVACGCLLSLVVALGDTGKMLTAVASLITAPHHLSQNTLQVCVHTILTAVYLYMYIQITELI